MAGRKGHPCGRIGEVMKKNDKLYHLEHCIMRDLFFAGGEKTLKKLSSWHFYRQIVNILNRIIPEERIVLREEDFTVTQGRVKGTDATILKVELPEPEESPLCRTIYMVYSNDLKERAFFTIERYDDGSYGLCGWLSPKCHVSFETNVHYNAWGERKRAEEIFEEFPEIKKDLEELIA